jgi:hypothetical protein
MKKNSNYEWVSNWSLISSINDIFRPEAGMQTSSDRLGTSVGSATPAHRFPADG